MKNFFWKVFLSPLVQGLRRALRHPKEREQNHFVRAAMRDSRQNKRYSLCYKNAAHIVTPRKEWLDIANISFDGFAIYIAEADRSKLFHSGHVGLHFLGEETTLYASQVYVGESVSGYKFTHENSGNLIFLRELIDYLKMGTSLQILTVEKLQESFRSPDWICLRGEGPSDLQIQVGKSGEIEKCRLMFRIGDEYYQLQYKDKKLQMDSTKQAALTPAPVVIRHGLSLMLGIQQPHVVRVLRPVFEAGIRQFPHAGKSGSL